MDNNKDHNSDIEHYDFQPLLLMSPNVIQNVINSNNDTVSGIDKDHNMNLILASTDQRSNINNNNSHYDFNENKPLSNNSNLDYSSCLSESIIDGNIVVNNDDNQLNTKLSIVLDTENIPVILSEWKSTSNEIYHVIDDVHWNDIKHLLHDDSNHEKMCSNIFQPGQLWKNHSTLKRVGNEYAKLTGFTLSNPDYFTLKYNRSGKDKTSCNLISGPLKCDCPWQLKIVSIIKIKTESTNKKNK